MKGCMIKCAGDEIAATHCVNVYDELALYFFGLMLVLSADIGKACSLIYQLTFQVCESWYNQITFRLFSFKAVLPPLAG